MEHKTTKFIETYSGYLINTTYIEAVYPGRSMGSGRDTPANSEVILYTTSKETWVYCNAKTEATARIIVAHLHELLNNKIDLHGFERKVNDTLKGTPEQCNPLLIH